MKQLDRRITHSKIISVFGGTHWVDFTLSVNNEMEAKLFASDGRLISDYTKEPKAIRTSTPNMKNGRQQFNSDVKQEWTGYDTGQMKNSPGHNQTGEKIV